MLPCASVPVSRQSPLYCATTVHGSAHSTCRPGAPVWAFQAAAAASGFGNSGPHHQTPGQVLSRLVRAHAVDSNNEQWGVDVAGLDAGPALAAAATAAAAAVAPSFSQHQDQHQHVPRVRTPLFQPSEGPSRLSSSGSGNIQQALTPTSAPPQSRPTNSQLQRQQQQQQQQQQRQRSGGLVRPTPVQPGHLRELLQQQIDRATCWAELQELLLGRRQVLTLKHMATMVKRVRVGAWKPQSNLLTAPRCVVRPQARA
jgi:hypothetical protein